MKNKSKPRLSSATTFQSIWSLCGCPHRSEYMKAPQPLAVQVAAPPTTTKPCLASSDRNWRRCIFTYLSASDAKNGQLNIKLLPHRSRGPLDQKDLDGPPRHLALHTTACEQAVPHRKFASNRPPATTPQLKEQRMELGAFSISLTVKDIEASRSFYEK